MQLSAAYFFSFVILTVFVNYDRTYYYIGKLWYLCTCLGWSMYWGSVRFYKHLILTVIGLLIVVPSVTSFVLLFKYINIKNENVECMSSVEFSNMFN